MKRDQYYFVQGRVVWFDPSTRQGEVELEERRLQLKFSSTCFYAGRFSRDPRTDERVAVALKSPAADPPMEDDVLGLWVAQ